MKRPTLWSFLAIVFFAPSLLAKSDVEVWSAAEVVYPMFKKVDLGFEQDLRLDDGARDFDETLSNFSLAFGLSRQLRLELGYRFELGGKLNDLKRAHRVHIQTRLKQKFGLLWVTYRLRLQHHVSDVETVLRQQVRLGWNTKTVFRPQIGVELFSDEVKKNHLPWKKMRWTIALICRLNKRQRLKIFSHLHQALNDNDPLEYVMGLNYQYRFKR